MVAFHKVRREHARLEHTLDLVVHSDGHRDIVKVEFEIGIGLDVAFVRYENDCPPIVQNLNSFLKFRLSLFLVIIVDFLDN